jgi:outer membrane immunogenic protein
LIVLLTDYQNSAISRLKFGHIALLSLVSTERSRSMRRTAILILGVAALSVAAVNNAFSADLGRRPIYKAPPPVVAPAPVLNWTGFYVGGFVGGAFPGQDVTATDLNGFTPSSRPWDYGLDNSFIGGGTLGYNWQFPGSPFVVGIEGEGGYLRLTGSAPDPVSPDFNTISSARMGDWYAVAAGRLGWLATPSWLLYAKGGAVWTDLHADVTAPNLVASASKTTTGWAAGGGAEWMFAPQWSVKAEYLYLGIDDNVEACEAAGTCWNHDFHGVHTVKVGLNYHF